MATYVLARQCAPLAADTLTFLQIAMYTSWRWIYWVLIIFIGVCWLLGLFFLKETYSPVLLARRAKEMRKETGDDSIMTEQERNKRPISDIVQEALLRPLGMSLPFAQRSSLETDLFFPPVMLFTEQIMIYFSGYLCLIYGLLYGYALFKTGCSAPPNRFSATLDSSSRIRLCSSTVTAFLTVKLVFASYVVSFQFLEWT